MGENICNMLTWNICSLLNYSLVSNTNGYRTKKSKAVLVGSNSCTSVMSTMCTEDSEGTELFENLHMKLEKTTDGFGGKDPAVVGPAVMDFLVLCRNGNKRKSFQKKTNRNDKVIS
ncbi:hypothetical protein LOAG_00452 [Loa loa]|uniref:Uncharacterized protein n=1 Tax=Loa loa TaxID=7209 RepID=A0A1S0UB71_LOALO|nr:hypothetical protein LOAG_00452 [Loa loa]EFO28036.2 hypothetical protein LOAG_00452 [Loa loa]